MGHNRKLVLGGVALTKARVSARENANAANRVRDELEQELIDSGFFQDAPFTWVGLIVRYGLKDELRPHYDAIAPSGDLPVAIEIDVHRLLGVTEAQMVQVYLETTLSVLIHIGERYGLPTARLRALAGDPIAG